MSTKFFLSVGNTFVKPNVLKHTAYDKRLCRKKIVEHQGNDYKYLNLPKGLGSHINFQECYDILLETLPGL